MKKPVVQTVFIVDLERLWRRVREREVEIVSGPKMTWAKLPNGRRTLLGKGAFFTRQDAETYKAGRLRKLEPRMRHFHLTRDLAADMREQIALYDAVGYTTLH